MNLIFLCQNDKKSHQSKKIRIIKTIIKIVGLTIFQTSVFIFYISMANIEGGTAPILAEGISLYSNPLPHVLILTAIVVGIATTALALALAVRIKEAYGSIEEEEIQKKDNLDC